MVNKSLVVSKRWLLYVGLVLMVVGTAFAMFSPSDESETLSYLVSLIRKGYVAVFVAACVIAPICEELSFRYWARGTVIARIVSIVGMTVYSYMGFGSIILSVLVLLVFTTLFLVLKFKEWGVSFILSIGLTSLLFASQHQSYPLTIINIADIIGKVGFSLVAIYLTIRWGIVISIMVHFLWNLALTLLVFCTLSFYLENVPSSYTVNSDQFSFSVVYKMDNNKGYYSKTVTEDSLILKNASMTQVVKSLSKDEDNCILIENISDKLLKFDLLARVSNKSNFLTIRDSIIARYNLVFDTLKPTNKFVLIDAEMDSSVNGTMGVSINYIKYQLNRILRKSVIVRNTLDKVTMSNNGFDMMGRAKDGDSLISILKKEGINILDPVESDVKLVTVSLDY